MRVKSTVISLLLLLLAACSEPSKQAAQQKEPAKPPEPVTGRYAFYQMYTAARSWAADLQPLQLVSMPIREVKVEGAKFGAWQAVFVSPSRQRTRIYTYSVAEAEGNIHKGVFGRADEAYTPRPQLKMFNIQAFKIDSDEALKVAMTKGAEYAKKNPDKPINFQLSFNDRYPNLVWRVYWGDSISSSNFSIVVDASTGDYKETMR